MQVDSYIKSGVSPQQARLFYFQDGRSIIFNQAVIRIEGLLHKEAFIECLNRLIARYPILTMRYDTSGVNERQGTEEIGGRAYDFNYQAWDNDATLHEYIENRLSLIQQKTANAHDARMDVQLIHVGRFSLLLLSIPAFRADSYSLQLIAGEILRTYFFDDTAGPEEIIHFHQYLDWQSKLLQVSDEQAREFWSRYSFQGYRQFKLPFEKASKSRRLTFPAMYRYRLDTNICSALSNLTDTLGTTMPVLLQTCLGILLYKHSGLRMIVLGTVSDCRDLDQIRAVVGPLAKVLPFYLNIDTDQSFLSLVKEAGALVEDILTWEDNFILEYNKGTADIFPLGFEYHRLSTNTYTGGVKSQMTELYSYPDFFKARVNFLHHSDGTIQADFYFDPSCLSAASAGILCAQLEGLMKNILSNPHARISDLNMLCQSDVALIQRFNDTSEVSSDTPGNFVALFERQLEKVAGASAIKFNETSISYMELNARSNQVAHQLIREYGVNRGDVVGLMLDRSEDLVIAALGILKAGAVFLPIDPVYPSERIQYILSDASAKVLITDSSRVMTIVGFYNGPLFAIDIQLSDSTESRQNLVVSRSAEDVAYVIYTSGSTGVPKGVVVGMKSFGNYLRWANRYYFNDTANYPFALFTSLSFDLTLTSIFSTLLRGDTICIYPESDISSTLRKVFDPSSGAKAVKMTPSHVTLLQYLGVKNTYVEKIILGGEAVTTEHVAFLKSLHDKLQVFNEYGPTEATIGCTIKELNDTDERITIGKPIDNSRIYITDKEMQLQPVGVEGELCIGGSVLALGYLNKKDLTNRKFVQNPFDDGRGYLYRTGDLARWNVDGELEYIGRADHQIKLNGYRIELEEIENVMASMAGLSQSIVVLKEMQNSHVLVCYYSGNDPVSVEEIRQHLERKLPVYMLPAHYVYLKTWPLTINGKIDRSVLQQYEVASNGSPADLHSANENEKKIADVWKQVLGHAPAHLQEDFFKAGGNSLKGIQFVSGLYKEFNTKIELRDLFDHPTIQQLAHVIEKSEKQSYIQIEPVEEREYYDVSHGQKRIWLLYQLEEEQTAYNMPHAFSLSGAVDTKLLRASLNALVARHESLRTTFVLAEGEVRQRIYTTQEFDLEEYDWSRNMDATRHVNELVESEATQVFNLEKGPLIKGKLIRLAEERYVFILTLHHIISDGWSNEVLIDELLTVYSSYKQGKPNPLAPLRIQYKDYASWQQKQLHGESYEKHKHYWQEQFSGEIPVLNLPADRVRPSVQSHRGASVDTRIDKRVTQGLMQLTEKAGCSMFMVLLATVKALLYRYTGQNDMIIGTPVAGRIHPDLENQIGFYVNTLAIRSQFEDQHSFDKLLQIIKERVLSAFEHQVYPFDKLVDSLPLQRDMSRSPLFDVMVILQNTHTTQEGKNMEGVVVEELIPSSESSKFDLTFNYNEIGDGEGLYLSVIYNPDLYDRVRIERMCSHYEHLLLSIINDSEAALNKLEYLTLQERQQLLVEFNATTSDYPYHKTIPQLIEEQVLKTPQKVAVIHDDEQLSYDQLNRRSNQLARYLQENCKVKTDDLVGIMISRNAQMVVSLLAILKSGAAYLPIDPTYPEERIKHMITDSRIKVLLTEEHYRDVISYNGQIITLEEMVGSVSNYEDTNVISATQSTDLAYVIYTSGSTGKPKGVALSHKNAVSFICWALEEFGQSPFDIVYAGTSYCFDLSIYEIFYTLSAGKTLRVIQSGAEIPNYLSYDENVLINTVPSVVNELMRMAIDLSNVTVLNMAGEPIPTHVRSGLDCDRIEVRNLYGPSEDTTYSSCHRLRSGETITPIGHPISNTRFYILDQALNLVSIGNPGEICISGEGLARGYLYQEALTAERFVNNPFEPGSRLYRTGDMGRWLPEGTVEFLGRKDHQVKVRGYRIELDEIESYLVRHDQIEEAIVDVKTDKEGQAHLVAYYTGSEMLMDNDLKEYLSTRLPMYMVPNHYIRLNKFPLTATGKIDRKSLPLPNAVAKGSSYAAPSTDLEKKLVQIWQELLEVKTIGIDDDFFHLGGHSLKATSLISMLYESLQIQVALKDVFSYPTIRTLAKSIEKMPESSADTLKQDLLRL